MNLTLNPFALVVKMDDVYHLILSDYANPVRMKPTARQVQMLDELHTGTFYPYDELCGVFGSTLVDALVKTGCLVKDSIDTDSIYSRTDAFFLTHNMPQARENLAGKKVLILGIGGIGTHLAWHLAALGIKKITVADFDKVEISNLNRQLLFDTKDVGKIKTEVIKKKIKAINPDVMVEIVDAKIASEEELESICLGDDYDLIIKALDSPAQFPIWLDNVARKHSLTYITGITMRENVLIGPSYIPGASTYGWSDLMDIKGNPAEKVYGIAPSLGVMLYHIADELAVEAFKILTGYGRPKYVDKILCKNILTDEQRVIQKGVTDSASASKDGGSVSWHTLMLNVVLMISLAVAGTQVGWFVPLSFIAAIVLPLIIYKESRDVVRCTFINATVFSIGLLIRVIGAVDLSTPAAVVSSLVMLFGLHSAVTLGACVMGYFGHKIFVKKNQS